MYARTGSLIFFLVIHLLFINSLQLYSSDLRLGISRLYSPHDDSPSEVLLALEEQLQGFITEIPAEATYALDSYLGQAKVKQYLSEWDDNSTDIADNESMINFIEEIRGIDYCFIPEILTLEIVNEPDFYDANIIYRIVRVDINILLVVPEAMDFREHHRIDVMVKVREGSDDPVNLAARQVGLQFRNYVTSLDILKPKIKSTGTKNLHLRINRGTDAGIRGGDVILAYDLSSDVNSVPRLARVVWAGSENAWAVMLTGKMKAEPGTQFVKQNSINLELQFAGGFSLSDADNNVVTKVPAENPIVSILGFAHIRGCIPVSLGFLRPVIAAEFTFLGVDNRLLLPFSIETGVQGEFYLNRFQVYAGLLVGALFSPDSSSVYQVDSVTVRPYLQTGALLARNASLFLEFGYRYFAEGILYRSWQVDLKGVYFLIGLGIKL
jgi:hypothetical protein